MSLGSLGSQKGVSHIRHLPPTVFRLAGWLRIPEIRRATWVGLPRLRHFDVAAQCNLPAGFSKGIWINRAKDNAPPEITVAQPEAVIKGPYNRSFRFYGLL